MRLTGNIKITTMKRINIVTSVIIISLLFYNCRIDDDDIVSYNPDNGHPVTNAGPDQVITVPDNSVVLDGTATIDPDEFINLYRWLKIDGNGYFNNLFHHKQKDDKS